MVTLTTALAWHLSAEAQAGPSAPSVAASAARPAMGFQQLIDHLTGQGYREVREVERKSDKLYEVSARDASGAWVELLVDARSGEVLKYEIERRKRK